MEPRQGQVYEWGAPGNPSPDVVEVVAVSPSTVTIRVDGVESPVAPVKWAEWYLAGNLRVLTQ